MAAYEERKACLLAYCKLDESELSDQDKLLLQLFHDSTVGYLSGAKIAEPDAESPYKAQYELCVYRMVLDAWDHRDLQEIGDIKESPAFRSAVNQLKLALGNGESDMG